MASKIVEEAFKSFIAPYLPLDMSNEEISNLDVSVLADKLEEETKKLVGEEVFNRVVNYYESEDSHNTSVAMTSAVMKILPEVEQWLKLLLLPTTGGKN